jgi:HSP20 family protein
MASKQELQVQQKRELEKKQETTIPARALLPTTDIYEDENELTVILEMPGVDKDNVEIRVQDSVLNVDGRLDFSKYQGLQPLYTEYNIGNYSRSFSLSNKIDQNRIAAATQSGDPALPESQADRPAFCHRTRRSPTAQYTKRRCQDSFGSFLGSGRAHADDGRVRYGAAGVRLRHGHHRFSR